MGGQEERDERDVLASAFDAFFAQHERPLFAYLRRLLPSDDVAVEIAQEAFFRAWMHFAEIQCFDRPQSWLYRVATNLSISALRRRQPVPLSQLLGRRRSDDDCDDGQETIEALLVDTLDIEGQTAERDSIARVLRRLSERERAALLLRAVQGFSHEEVAEALGASVANARKIATRAREHFRQLYEHELRREGEAVG
ncbi:MAG TPA: RNA polymerase sigma factor [Ktedonobacterales bacterium]|nr:RNA polymerase sigma factor [Ktedonobacterales bacterium]